MTNWLINYWCGAIFALHARRMALHPARFRTPLLSEKIKRMSQFVVDA